MERKSSRNDSYFVGVLRPQLRCSVRNGQVRGVTRANSVDRLGCMATTATAVEIARPMRECNSGRIACSFKSVPPMTSAYGSRC